MTAKTLMFDFIRLLRFTERVEKRIKSIEGENGTLLYDKYNGVYTLGESRLMIETITQNYIVKFLDFVRPAKASEIRDELLARCVLDCGECAPQQPCTVCRSAITVDAIDRMYYFRTEVARQILLQFVGMLQCQIVLNREEAGEKFISFQKKVVQRIAQINGSPLKEIAEKQSEILNVLSPAGIFPQK